MPMPSIRPYSRAIAAVFVGCGIWAGTAGLGAAAPCQQPDVAAVLDRSRDVLGSPSGYFPSLRTTLLQVFIDGVPMQWLGVIWAGPTDGALFLLDCAGQVVAMRKTGGVTALSVGPHLPIGQSLAVSHIPSTGLGVAWAAIALVHYRDGSIQILWEHLVHEAVSAGNLADYEDSFYWDLSADGLAIRVTGQRKVGTIRDDQYGWAPGTINDLPAKTFCWNAAAVAFQPCR